MKIGYFMDTYLPQVTGISYGLQNTISQLVSEGHELYLISPSPLSDSCGEKHPVPSFSLPFRDQKIGFASPNSVGDLDVVHVHQPYTIGLAGLYKARKEKVPLVYTFHTDHSSIISENTSSQLLGNLASRMFGSWEKIFLRRAEKIITPTNIVRKSYLSNFDGKVEVLPNPIDTELFQPCPSQDLKTFSKKKGKVIGYAGRIAREKDIETLIKLADHFEGMIYIVGGGEAKKHYERLAEGKSNLEFRDFIAREDLPAFFSHIDFFVNPSVSETQGMTVLEANSCGTPVLGADSMALKEVIEHGKNGLLFEPGNVKDLYDKLQRGYEIREELSEKSREVSSRYSPPELTRRLMKIYRKVSK